MMTLSVSTSIYFFIGFLIPLLFILKLIMQTKRKWVYTTLLFLYLLLGAFAANSGFFLDFEAIPPRLFLLLLPSILFMLWFFNSAKMKPSIDQLDFKGLTTIHVLRVPIELFLWQAFLDAAIPEIMTFEGRNFDVFAGITAPVIAYLFFEKKKLNATLFLAWNIICLGLLLNIVITAILSVPTPFQQFAFDRPNTLVMVFPFIFLPSLIVPFVAFSHIASIRYALNLKQTFSAV